MVRLNRLQIKKVQFHWVECKTKYIRHKSSIMVDITYDRNSIHVLLRGNGDDLNYTEWMPQLKLLETFA